jgi:hypothetical protein
MRFSKWHSHTHISKSSIHANFCLLRLTVKTFIQGHFFMFFSSLASKNVILIHCDLVWWIHRRQQKKKSNIVCGSSSMFLFLVRRGKLECWDDRSTAWVSLFCLKLIISLSKTGKQKPKTFSSAKTFSLLCFCIVQQFSIFLFLLFFTRRKRERLWSLSLRLCALRDEFWEVQWKKPGCLSVCLYVCMYQGSRTLSDFKVFIFFYTFLSLFL